MENAKNFILSLKFPFSLVKENRFIMDVSAPKEGGGAADAKDSGETIPADAALDKKREDNLKRDAEIDKELDDISKKSNLKETQLAQVVEEFRKKPEPVSDGDKQDYDKEVAAIRLELMAMTSKRKALIEERKGLNAYKDPRIEAFDAKARVEQLKGEIEEGKKKFFDGLMSRLDAVKIAERRAEFKINADKWDITSKSGLDAVKKDWIDLKIFENTPFFQNIFAQLEKLAPEKTAGLPDDVRKLYLNPEANVNKIEDKALAAAISFFVSIKELLKTQDNFQMAGDARSQEKDQDKIASTGIKFVTDNVRKFHDAIKQKDWGTAAVYVIGAYIAYQGAKKIWEHTPDLAKKGLYAAGFLYVANMFAKNAGYDVMKKLGITAAEDDVRGTSLANFYNLNEVPDGKKLDGRVLLDIGGVTVSDLNSLYTETNSAGIQTIDPNAFVPSPFGDKFKGMVPSVLTKEGPLTSKEEEYRRVGKELYKIAKVVRESYDKYIKPKNGLTIEQALRKDPDLKNASLMSFAMLFNSVAQSGRERVSGGIFGDALNIASYKMRKRFDSVFKDKKIGFEAVHTPIAPGVFGAQVMDFPIVIREDGVNKEYVVFSRYDYDTAKGNPDAITQALCKIPFEGSADDQIIKLSDGIKKKFAEVVKKLNASASKDLELADIDYKDGRFVSKLKIKKESWFGEEKIIDVFLKVSKDGSTVEVYKEEDKELFINLDSSGDAKKPIGNLILAALCQQDNMKPFFFLYKAKKLVFKEKIDDNTFVVLAGDSKVEIKFKMDEKARKFVLAGSDSEIKELFSTKNYAFLRELAENAVYGNEMWKRETERFGNVLENVPEDYMMNLFKSAPTWWKEATSYKWFRGFSADQFTGSIPKNYTKAMVGAQTEFLVSRKVMEIVGSGGTLKGASDAINDDKDIKDAADRLKKLTTKLSNIKEQKERDGKEMSSEDFKKNILADVSKLAIKSNTYALWYEQFSTHIHMKYGKDGLIKGNTQRAAKILGVFAAYTYKMDVASMDGTIDVKRASYVNYVAEQMFSKLNEWSGSKPVAGEILIDIPDRGPRWEIDEWSKFDKAYGTHAGEKYKTVGVMTPGEEEGTEERGEILAETAKLKMSDDYTSFEDWLGKSSKERKKYNKNNVLLSKDTEEHTVKIKTQAEYLFYMDLLDKYEHDDTIDTIKHTQLQKEFYNALHKGIKGLKDEFSNYLPEEGSTKHDKLQALEDESYVLRLETLSPPLSDGVQTPPFDLTYKVDNNVFWADTQNLEQEMRAFSRSKGLPLTKSVQRKFIAEKVKKILKDRIAGEDTWEEYFEKKTAWNVFSTRVIKFVDKLNLF